MNAPGRLTDEPKSSQGCSPRFQCLSTFVFLAPGRFKLLWRVTTAPLRLGPMMFWETRRPILRE